MAYNESNISFGPNYIIPKPLDPRLISTISPAVARAAMESGVAQKPITDWDAYVIELNKRLGIDNQLIRALGSKARKNPKRVVFADAENVKILKAAQIAADELRHAKAYKAFVTEIFKLDPSEMMIAFADMMKKKIVMPAHFLREINGAKSSVYEHFSDAAQRIGVYTTMDYISIMQGLIKDWDIEKMSGLNDVAEKARDYVANLPTRLEKLADRVKIPELAYPFTWIVQ
jgi:hypothetical protein